VAPKEIENFPREHDNPPAEYFPASQLRQLVDANSVEVLPIGQKAHGVLFKNDLGGQLSEQFETKEKQVSNSITTVGAHDEFHKILQKGLKHS
jgi:hypothetical protein